MNLQEAIQAVEEKQLVILQTRAAVVLLQAYKDKQMVAQKIMGQLDIYHNALKEIIRNDRHGPVCGDLNGQWAPGVYIASAAIKSASENVMADLTKPCPKCRGQGFEWVYGHHDRAKFVAHSTACVICNGSGVAPGPEVEEKATEPPLCMACAHCGLDIGDMNFYCGHTKGGEEGRSLVTLNTPRIEGEFCGPEGLYFKQHPGRDSTGSIKGEE